MSTKTCHRKKKSIENHTTHLSLLFSLFFAPLGSLTCCEHHCFVCAPTDGPSLWHPSQYVLRAHTHISFWPSTNSMFAVAKGLVSYCKAPPPEGAPRLLFNNSLLVAYLSWCVLQRVLRPDPRMTEILSIKNSAIRLQYVQKRSFLAVCLPNGTLDNTLLFKHAKGFEDGGPSVQRPRPGEQQRRQAHQQSVTGEETSNRRRHTDTKKTQTGTENTRQPKKFPKGTRIYAHHKTLLLPPCERCRAPNSTLAPRKLTMPDRQMTYASSSALLVQACRPLCLNGMWT